MDTRHFELQDLLAAALIALEAGDRAAAEAALRRAMAWVEHDWLATPGEISGAGTPGGPLPSVSGEDDDED